MPLGHSLGRRGPRFPRAGFFTRPPRASLGQVPFAVPQTWTSGDAVATLVTCVLPISAAKLVQTALIELPTPLGTFPRKNLSPAPSLHP